MKPIGTFRVVPTLPRSIERLRELAYNLRWAWDHDTIALFRRLDSDLWETSGHNPVLMLGLLDQARLEEAAHDEAFLAHLARVGQDFDQYMTNTSTWFDRRFGSAPGEQTPAAAAAETAGDGAGGEAGEAGTRLSSRPVVASVDEMHDSARSRGPVAHPPLVAYFSAEFGLTESLSIFAGGLGILAGDHLKSSSDLGVPLVGVGLLYQQGYYRQYLNEAGWQQEAYVDNDFHNLPLVLERGPSGRPLTVEVAYPGRTVTAQVWRAQVGRTPLYLLDTNIPSNRAADDAIVHQLYGGDLEMRLMQELMLGIGGMRALEALGLEPAVYHMNEGHAAFLALERIRKLMERHHLSFDEARQVASASLIFTTHTPVAAGHDYFPPDMMHRYFDAYARQMGIPFEQLMSLGRQNPADQALPFGRQDPADPVLPFGMTVLALRMAAHSNGVSVLHGEVSRQMWQVLWPGVRTDEVPIGHVTNGVHFRTWISREMDQLYDRYLGPRWREEPGDPEVWRRIERVPAEEIWRTHEVRRQRLVAYARTRLRQQLEQRGRPEAEIEAADYVLDTRALTIGFARRFATYKRATLLLRDPDRLGRILDSAQRPVQVIFAGKAHPRDEEGKALIQKVVEVAREKPFRHRVVFIEDYDMAVARYMVQGCDVWLNTPRRLMEASGTSGMKAVANGVLTLSTLDGWWDEAWRRSSSKVDPIGWAIGRGEMYEDLEKQDDVEAEALYDLLEEDVIPSFYDREANGVPPRWVARMKASVGRLCPFFNTHRMVGEYTGEFYVPAAARSTRLAAEGMAEARSLVAWQARLRDAWPRVRIESIDTGDVTQVPVGGAVDVLARVQLGGLAPDDVQVQLYEGRLTAEREMAEAHTTPLAPQGAAGDGAYTFGASAACGHSSGLHGFTVRVLPSHPNLATPFLPGLIAWAAPGVRVS